MIGTILRWNPKGFCFVRRDDGMGDTFVHARTLMAAGIDADTGVEGLRISFDVAFRSDGKAYADRVQELPTKPVKMGDPL
jgi:cold shock CspA family protein